jgi:hypothetical protein
LERDEFLIDLPEGWTVKELPLATNLKTSFAAYKGTIESREKMLVYTREYRLSEPVSASSKFDEVVRFFRGINTDERNCVILEKK